MAGSIRRTPVELTTPRPEGGFWLRITGPPMTRLTDLPHVQKGIPSADGDQAPRSRQTRWSVPSEDHSKPRPTQRVTLPAPAVV